MQGPGVVSDDASAVELVARHEMQLREKERLKRSKAPSEWDNSRMFESAPDGVLITVELFRARGLMSKDGRCEAYPKGFVEEREKEERKFLNVFHSRIAHDGGVKACPQEGGRCCSSKL